MVVFKKAELAIIENLGANSTDGSKQMLKSETFKLLTDLYVKAQKTVEEIQACVQSCQQYRTEVHERSEAIAAMIAKDNIHAESKQSIQTNRVCHHRSWHSVNSGCAVLDDELLKMRKQCEEICEKVMRTSDLADGYLEQFNAALKSNDDSSSFDFQSMDLVPQDDAFEEPNLQNSQSDLEKSPKDWSKESIDHLYQMWKVCTQTMDMSIDCVEWLESGGEVFRSSVDGTQSLARGQSVSSPSLHGNEG